MAPRLIALTEDARSALDGHVYVIPRLPFRIGRESRTLVRRISDATDRRLGAQIPTNDLYIVDIGEYFNISREHVVIEQEGEEYFITDLGSVCGTIVEGKLLGGNRTGGRTQLYDQDVIILGTALSPFIFKFRTD